MISTHAKPDLLRPRAVALVLGLALLALLTAPAVRAQAVASPFDADYSIADLGTVPGLPSTYGGLTIPADDPNTMMIGGLANSPSGGLYAVALVRDATGHITGFGGSAVLVADAPYPDGGLAYGPSGVLFMARWPVNEVGQMMSGSTAIDKVVSLGPLGVANSPGGLNFVPAGFPGAGGMKLVTWEGGGFYDLTLSPDGAGTYDITSATLQASLSGGPEGFVYVPAGSPQLDAGAAMLVSEYDNGSIAVYDVDASGNPVPSSRRTFVSGLAWALGAATDPLTGDFLFSTFGVGERVVAVRGFAAPPAACTPRPEVCDNGRDDDCDDLVDGDDDDCDTGGGEGDSTCDPCADWRNHGEYVSCVAQSVKDLVKSGAMSRADASAATSAAAASDVGKKGHVPQECAAR